MFEEKINHTTDALKFVSFSTISIVCFFVKMPFLGNRIIIDFCSSWLQTNLMVPVRILTVIGIGYGAMEPLVRRTVHGTANWVYAICRVVGFIGCLMYVFNIGPAWLIASILKPGLDSVIIPGGIMQILGGLALVLMSSYGLFEFIGVYARPFMRKLFKLPGLAALNVVTSYVGNYIPGSQVANQMYSDGHYTNREMARVLCAFGTNSLVFLLVFVNICGTMAYWNWLVVSITLTLIIVGAFTTRLWPIHHAPNTYIEGITPVQENDPKDSKWKTAVNEALNTAHSADSVFKLLSHQALFCIIQFTKLMSISMGFYVLISLFVKFVPLFDYLAYIFLPLTKLLGHVDAFSVAKALAICPIDVMVACTQSVGLNLYSRFTINVVVYTTVSGKYCACLNCYKMQAKVPGLCYHRF